jgi:hypothetical protein
MNSADLGARAASQGARWLAIGSCLTILAAALPAAAQTAGEPVGVANRARPDYDPIGEKLGSLMLLPQLRVEAEHSDNIFATDANTVSDSYVQVSPALTVKTDWPRHAVSATVRGTFSRFDKLKSQDTDEWAASANGRLDVTRDLKVNLNVAHNDLVEPRTEEIYAITPREPVTYTRDFASLSVSQSFNRLRVSGSASVADYSYDDTRDLIGDLLDQSYRDRKEIDAELRLGYAVSPMTAFFVEGGVGEHQYDKRTALGGSRDASFHRLSVGVEGELTRLIHGEASVGYVHYDFDNPLFDDTDDFTYKLALEWYPSELLTVGLAGRHALNDTPLPGAPGYINQSLTLTADYELRRNVILSGRLMAGRDEYQGVGGYTARRYGGSLAAKYLVSRGVGLSLRYDHEQRDSSGVSGVGFRDNTLGVGVTLER